MCFYYCITKKKAQNLIKNGIIKESQLNLFEDIYLTNGFDNPVLPVITNEEPGKISFFYWGLIPEWIKAPEDAEKIRKNTLNAKAETIFTKPSYRQSILKRRCLVLCSGFFEWQQVKGKKYPYYITLKDDEMFVFGGIWNSWVNKQTGEIINTYSVITVGANELLSEIHNTKKRMPLMIEPEKALQWLDKDLTVEQIKSFLKPYDYRKMKAHTIKKIVPSLPDELKTSDIIAYYHYPELVDMYFGEGDGRVLDVRR